MKTFPRLRSFLNPHDAAVNTRLRGESSEADALLHPPPPSNELSHLEDQNLSGRDRGILLHGQNGHGHEGRGRQCDHGCVPEESRHGSAHGDVRAGARGHAHGYAHGCGPCRYGNVRGSVHESDHAHANVCVRAFLP